MQNYAKDIRLESSTNSTSIPNTVPNVAPVKATEISKPAPVAMDNDDEDDEDDDEEEEEDADYIANVSSHTGEWKDKPLAEERADADMNAIVTKAELALREIYKCVVFLHV
jgi:hypothetical protein